jgi:hypothetical protein
VEENIYDGYVMTLLDFRHLLEKNNLQEAIFEAVNALLEKDEKAIYKEPMEHLDYIAQPAWDKHVEYMETVKRSQSKVRNKVEHSGPLQAETTFLPAMGTRSSGCSAAGK